jgi:hypothetical protein
MSQLQQRQTHYQRMTLRGEPREHERSEPSSDLRFLPLGHPLTRANPMKGDLKMSTMDQIHQLLA